MKVEKVKVNLNIKMMKTLKKKRLKNESMWNIVKAGVYQTECKQRSSLKYIDESKRKFKVK